MAGLPKGGPCPTSPALRKNRKKHNGGGFFPRAKPRASEHEPEIDGLGAREWAAHFRKEGPKGTRRRVKTHYREKGFGQSSPIFLWGRKPKTNGQDVCQHLGTAFGRVGRPTPPYRTQVVGGIVVDLPSGFGTRINPRNGQLKRVWKPHWPDRHGAGSGTEGASACWPNFPISGSGLSREKVAFGPSLPAFAIWAHDPVWKLGGLQGPIAGRKGSAGPS